MKRLVILATFFALLVVGLALWHVHAVQAEKRYETQGVDRGYDNEDDDQYSCRWRAPYDAEVQEEDVPGEGKGELFYKETPRDQQVNACETVTAIMTSIESWQKFEEQGEAALWPPFCLNVLNFYIPSSLGSMWHGLYGSLDWNINYDTWTEAYYFANGIFNKRMDPPDVDLYVANPSPTKGQDLQIQAAALGGIHSAINGTLIGWSTRRPGGRWISQQGIVAGGKEITEVAGTLDNRVEACRAVTRASQETAPRCDGTNSDNCSDRDGVNDAWELRYGFDPHNGADAQADPDGDGFDITDVARNFAEGNDFRGDCILGVRACPMHPTPDTTAQSLPGDGKFTNEEEFIWGTNPLDPDSDDDGYPDEADIVGMGQQEFRTLSDLEPNTPNKDRIEVRATMVSASNMVNEDNSGTRKTRIDSESRTVIAGVESDLKVSLSSLIDNPVNADPTTNTAEAMHSVLVLDATPTNSEGDRAVLNYDWSLTFENKDGRISEQQALPTRSGMGKYQLRIPVRDLAQYEAAQSIGFSAAPGEVVHVSVTVVNPVTKEVNFDRVPVSIGDLFDFKIEVDRGNGFEDYGTFVRDLPADHPCRDPKQLERPVADVLPFCAFAGTAVRVTVIAHNEQPNGLVYDWYENGQKNNAVASNVYTFTPQGPGNHWEVAVSTHGVERRRAERFSAKVNFLVQGPILVIANKPSSPVAGSPVDVYAALLNAPTNSSVNFTWTAEEESSLQTETFSASACPPAGEMADVAQIDFGTAPCTKITLHPDTPTSYLITVTANYIAGGTEKPIFAERALVVESPEEGTQQVSARLRSTTAALGGYVRSLYQRFNRFLDTP